MTAVELRRLFHEWRTRLHRVQQVLQPPQWTERDWLHFSRALYILVKKYGSTWQTETVHYWDIRWQLREGGELICQVEEEPQSHRRSLVVAQTGGFVEGVESYTWFYGELNEDGNFVGNPYWVDGNWKDALAMILLPHQMAAGFYLADSSVPLKHLMLGDDINRYNNTTATQQAATPSQEAAEVPVS